MSLCPPYFLRSGGEGYSKFNYVVCGFLLMMLVHHGNTTELMVVFWRLCELNSAFVQHCVATPEALLHIVAPILYHINQCRLDPSMMPFYPSYAIYFSHLSLIEALCLMSLLLSIFHCLFLLFLVNSLLFLHTVSLPILCLCPIFHLPARMGLLHVGIYTLLLLSGDRGFAVRLNTAYDNSVVFDFPSFSGNYADLLVLVGPCLGWRNIKPLLSSLVSPLAFWHQLHIIALSHGRLSTT